jgi:hypothetical protein
MKRALGIEMTLMKNTLTVVKSVVLVLMSPA